MSPLVTVALAAAASGLNPDIGRRTGDLDVMLEARVVRVLVPYSRTLYFNDRGKQRGLTADTLSDFEIFLNKKFPIKNRPIVVVALPSTRESGDRHSRSHPVSISSGRRSPFSRG